MRGGARYQGESRSSVAGSALRRRRATEAAPERLLRAAELDRTDRALAIAAMCVTCRRGSAVGVRDCSERACPLWRLRPYAWTEPRGAPHLDRLEPTDPLDCFGPMPPGDD